MQKIDQLRQERGENCKLKSSDIDHIVLDVLPNVISRGNEILAAPSSVDYCLRHLRIQLLKLSLLSTCREKGGNRLEVNSVLVRVIKESNSEQIQKC